MDARLEEIARRHGIELILLFGSSVSGPVHARSDVDLAVLLDRPTLPLREHGELAGELQRLFPDREVDLIRSSSRRSRSAAGSSTDPRAAWPS